MLGGNRAGEAPPANAYAIVSQGESQAQSQAPAAVDDKQKKLRFLVGGTLYRNWESVPEHYKVPPATTSLDPESSAQPLFKIKW